MVATSHDVQNTYLKELKPLESTILIHKCEKLRTRVMTRCAGLLEVGFFEDPIYARLSEAESSFDVEKLYRTKVKFLHRTARDFLLKTKAGHAIAGKPLLSWDQRFVNLARARMTSVIQGFEEFDKKTICDIMCEINEVETDHEISLLKDLRRVCEACSASDSVNSDIRRHGFWKEGFGQDFETCAAYLGCVKYIQKYFEHEHMRLSPYYKGSLFLGLVFSLQYRSSKEHYELLNLLADSGADLHTSQCWGESANEYRIITTPCMSLLQSDPFRWIDKNVSTSLQAKLAIEAAQLIKQVVQRASKSDDVCVTGVYPQELVELSCPVFGMGKWKRLCVVTQMGVDCLYRRAVSRLVRSGARVGSTRFVLLVLDALREWLPRMSCFNLP